MPTKPPRPLLAKSPLFLEVVTADEHKSQGKGLAIEFGIHSTPFGKLFVAQTARGVHRAAFLASEADQNPLLELQRQWPLASVTRNDESTGLALDGVLSRRDHKRPLSIQVTGSLFQIAVWQALLRIPFGALMSYSQLAAALGMPQSARAVGNAIGANPVALFIPCHRVVQQSGALGGYRWGPAKKQLIQAWEQAQAEKGQACTSGLL